MNLSLKNTKEVDMKARVKQTGEIVEVDFYLETKKGKLFGEVTDSKRLCKPDSTYRKFYRDEIEFLSYEDTPTYWEKLLHQYAGMAMQGILSNQNIGADVAYMVNLSTELATALVEKLKESKV